MSLVSKSQDIKRSRLSLLLWKAQSVVMQPEALKGSAGRFGTDVSSDEFGRIQQTKGQSKTKNPQKITWKGFG